MRTFDQAVDIAMVLNMSVPDSELELARLRDLQMGFRDDACSNETVTVAINQMVTWALVEVNLVNNDDPDSAMKMKLAIASGMFSTFLWGVAVGREMEKADL